MYDAVIVGAGPAGSMTALEILRGDPTKRVLLVDRRKELGRPVQCAGGIVKDRLDSFNLPVLPEEVVASELRGAVIHSPGGVEARWDAGRTRGYVMHRDRFDQWLATLACGAGAVLVKEDPAQAPRPYDYDTRYLIGADGWASQLGKHFLLKTDMGSDFHLGIEYHVRLEERCDPHYFHFYFGNKLAPGGYIWVFPEGEHNVRIGCGVTSGYSAKTYLTRFLHGGRPDQWAGEVVGLSAGGIIPTARPVERLFTKTMRPMMSGAQWVALVGDAARMTDPVHGGGIANAMEAAIKLGEVITSTGDPLDYQVWFDKNLGAELERRYLMKKVMMDWEDRDLDAMVEVMASLEVADDVPVQDLVRQLVVGLLRKKPMLFPRFLGQVIRAKFRG